MGRKSVLAWSFIAGIILSSGLLNAASVYTVRLDDPAAVYLTPESFPVRGDGVADDSDALQQAIDKVGGGPASCSSPRGPTASRRPSTSGPASA